MTKLVADMAERDVEQWLANAYTLIEHDGQMKVGCFMRTMGSEVAFALAGDTCAVVSREAITCHWPLGGAINIASPGSPLSLAGFLIREQYKQYRRTYVPSCCSFAIPRLWDVTRLVPTAPTFQSGSRAVIEAAFFPTYPSWQECMESIGVAIAPDRNTIIVKLEGIVYVYTVTGLIGTMKSNVLVPFAGANAACARLAKRYNLELGDIR